MSRDDIEHGWLVSNAHEEEREQKHTCDWCEEDILEGDEYYEFSGEKVCLDCVRRCKKMA